MSRLSVKIEKPVFHIKGEQLCFVYNHLKYIKKKLVFKEGS